MIIAIANQKGGVAKTTSTICLGGLLASELSGSELLGSELLGKNPLSQNVASERTLSRRQTGGRIPPAFAAQKFASKNPLSRNVASQKTSCLAIDLDPQGNLTTGLGVEVIDGQLTTYEVITERSHCLDAVVKTNSGLYLLPADITLAQGEPEIAAKVGNFYLLRERLEPVKTKYAHILIDCPPSLGLLTVNGLACADAVLIPVQCQFFALKGLAGLLNTIESVTRRLNSNLKILGVLPTMAESTVMTQDVLATLKQRFEKEGVRIFPPVPKSIRFPESNLAGEPIHTYSDSNKHIYPYKAIAKVVLES